MVQYLWHGVCFPWWWLCAHAKNNAWHTSWCSVKSDYMNAWGTSIPLSPLAPPSALPNFQMAHGSSPTGHLNLSHIHIPTDLGSVFPISRTMLPGSWAQEGSTSPRGKGLLLNSEDCYSPTRNLETKRTAANMFIELWGFRDSASTKWCPTEQFKTQSCKPSVPSWLENKNIPTTLHIQINTL